MNTKSVKFRASLKTILGVTFKIALIIIGVLAAIVIYALVYDRWDDHHGERGGRTISQKHKVYVQYYADGTARIKNGKTGRWTTPKIRWAGNEPPQDSISVYCDREGLRGFYNTHTGEITLSGRYRHAWYFSDGVAGVVGMDGKVRFINYDGCEAVPGAFPYSQGFDYAFHDGLCVMYFDSTNTRGLLRKDGTWALEPVYTYISGAYVGGWRIVSKEDGFQFLKEDFTPAFPGTYEYMEMAADGKGVYAMKNHVKQLLDYTGNVLEPFIIDGTYPLKCMSRYNDTEADEYEIIPEIVVYRVQGWEGLMDKRTGKVLTPANYHDFTPISRHLLLAQIEYWDDESVVMDLKGNIIKN